MCDSDSDSDSGNDNDNDNDNGSDSDIATPASMGSTTNQATRTKVSEAPFIMILVKTLLDTFLFLLKQSRT